MAGGLGKVARYRRGAGNDTLTAGRRATLALPAAEKVAPNPDRELRMTPTGLAACLRHLFAREVQSCVRDSCHGGAVETPTPHDHARARCSRPGAGRGNASVVVGLTRAGSRPSPAKIAGRSRTTSSRRRSDVIGPERRLGLDHRHDRAGQVERPGGLPRWSSTTDTVSRSAASRAMVATKFGPWAPYSQAVRTTHEAAGQLRAAPPTSPAALVRPYADRGAGGASSAYGRGRRRRRRRSRWTAAPCARRKPSRRGPGSPLRAR
jgi:hypothetical protein